ncbi:hypothetical protein BDW74DRAFT_178559 [Aspergillus multicolor]|uniref:uncharacterized protein n=1 Tax=Aspergillus multicolor TaxID=41759 RepID=UPI003CCCD9DD
MRPSSLEVYFLLVSSVTADFLSARSFDHGQNIELGDLADVHDFYAILEQSAFRLSQNGSFVWEDITEYETFDDPEGDSEFMSHSTLPGSGLVTREDQCKDSTGITRTICDNVPSRMWFWVAGSALLIYYLPRTMTRLLNIGS